MENSRQNTRFHWRNAKRLERLSETVDTTDDGKLQVNEGVIVNADNETISVTQDMKDAIAGNNEVVISITDDDWDDEQGIYVKHVELNNTFISFNFTGTHPFSLRLYCPHFKGLAYGYNATYIREFSGISFSPKDRYVKVLITDIQLAVFNGVVTQIELDY